MKGSVSSQPPTLLFQGKRVVSTSSQESKERQHENIEAPATYTPKILSVA